MLHSTAQACKLARCFPPAQRRRSWPSARSPPFPSLPTPSPRPPTRLPPPTHPPTHPPAVAAVHDGYLLQKSVTAVPLAGRTLARCMAGCVAAKGAAIRPRFEFRRKEGAGGAMEVRSVHACARRRVGAGVEGGAGGAMQVRPDGAQRSGGLERSGRMGRRAVDPRWAALAGPRPRPGRRGLPRRAPPRRVAVPALPGSLAPPVASSHPLACPPQVAPVDAPGTTDSSPHSRLARSLAHQPCSPAALPLLQVVPVDAPGITDSYRRWAVEGVAGEMKDAICR